MVIQPFVILVAATGPFGLPWWVIVAVIVAIIVAAVM